MTFLKSIFRHFDRYVLIIIALIIGLYWKFFLKGQIPFPGDLLIGAYFPWYDYKWGNQVGVQIQNPILSDVFSQFILWKYLAIDQMKAGYWPLWNPYNLSGMPLLANYQSAPFFIFNILLLLPKYYGWGLYIFSQTLVAALGMYFFLTNYTKNKLAVLSGVMVFSLSGLMTTWLELGNGVWAAAMLPWIFFSIDKYLFTQKNRYLFLMIVIDTNLYLAGHAQLIVYSLVLVFSYLLYKYINEIHRHKIIYLKIILCLIISISIAAIQLLPAYQLTSASIRAGEQYTKSSNYGLSATYDLVRLFIADFFGNPVTGNYFGTLSYNELSSFLGTITLALILPLVWKVRKKTPIFYWLIIFYASLFLAVDNPITQLIYSSQIPLLTFSFASRILFVTSFAGGVLVTFGLEKFMNELEYGVLVRKATILLLAVIVGILLGYTAVIITVYPYRQQVFITELLEHIKIPARNTILPIIMLVILFITSFKITKYRLLAIILVAILFFDLSRYFIKYNPFISNNLIFPETPVLSYLQEQPGLFRIIKLGTNLLPANTWMQYKLSTLEGYESVGLSQYAMFFNVINNKPVSAGFTRFMGISDIPWRFLDAMNVKYVLALSTLDGKKYSVNFRVQDKRLVMADEDKSTVVTKNPTVKERAFFVNQVITVDNERKVWKQLEDTTFNPSNQAVVLSDNPISVLAATSSAQVKITQYAPTSVTLKTSTSGVEFLVFSDTYTPDWQLLSDGRQEKLYQTDGALRGIIVQPGVHNYQMIYKPKWFYNGLYITLGGMVLLLFGTIYSISKKIW